jgi:predicted alpha-1,2-mannosidase
LKRGRFIPAFLFSVNFTDMKKIWIAALGCCLTWHATAQSLTRYVDPFLGTGGHGHVFPGAMVPFGMVQLSPDNGTEGWDWCGGYHYSSDGIAGFSHTHLSGTGIGDWCDISVLPLTDTAQIHQSKIKIPFSHQQESARPGFYQVRLGNGVRASLTAADRIGFHRYQFEGSKAWLRFDMGFAINWDKSTDGMLELLNDTTVVGYRFSTGWAKNQRVFFAARFSSPVQAKQFIDAQRKDGRRADGPLVKILVQFELGDKPLEVRVALSSVGVEKALLELNQYKQSFDQTTLDAERRWEKELKKIQIESKDEAFKTRFYTALYRTCMAPTLYGDRDGAYRTPDNRVQQMPAGKQKYTVFSLWDTFRALHPLYTITQTDRLPDLLASMMAFYNDNGLLPVWDLSTWETNTMTGYHAIPVLADAILKGLPGIDPEKAYAAMVESAMQQQRGTADYARFGYLPQDKHGWSVTITLEYAFDDWCIAQVAKKLGKQVDYEKFSKRALSYQRLFDPVSGFMRAKDSMGKFIEPFDPLLSEHGFEGQYIEGTAWQHSFFVPHDVPGLAKLYGGREKLVAKLDALFNSPSELHGENTSADVSGLIGQYAHGNEPSHHIIYMYTLLGQPEKAAARIRQVADSMYKNGPDGLSGNDDCGQMSAWLVWSSLGMYPLNPANGQYVFGLPLVDQARVQLPNGKQLTLTVQPGDPKGSKGIQKVQWNGKSIPVVQISHAQLLQGGQLTMWVKR